MAERLQHGQRNTRVGRYFFRSKAVLKVEVKLAELHKVNLPKTVQPHVPPGEMPLRNIVRTST